MCASACADCPAGTISDADSGSTSCPGLFDSPLGIIPFPWLTVVCSGQLARPASIQRQELPHAVNTRDGGALRWACVLSGLLQLAL